jgi:RHS repeat-associated protein
MNGLVEHWRYDRDWRVQERVVQDATSRQVYRSGLSYDCLGRIIAMEDSRRGRRQFGYDAASHLSAVDWDTSLPERAPERYTFDSRGTLRAVQDRPVPPRAATNSHCLDWLADAHGASCQLAYDVKDQLITVHSTNGRAWQYRYDAFGRRTRKIQRDHGAETARWEYLWDMDVLLAERYIQGEHRSQRLYLCHGLTVYARIDEDETGQRLIVYHPDHLATPDVCTDATGAIVWQRDSTAFGARHNTGAIAQHIGFPGQYWDPESALFYNRHRHYDPQAAQYLQPDPLGVTAGWHPHQYPTNPLTLADPLGLAAEYSIDTLRPTAYRRLHEDEGLLRAEEHEGLSNMYRLTGQSQRLAQSLGQPTARHLYDDVGNSNSLSGVEQLVLDGHGFPGGMEIDGQPITARQLAEELLAQGFQGDTVVLDVCHAAEVGQRRGQGAQGSGSLAQDLADELKGATGRNFKVIGARGTVINNGDGTLMTGNEVFARSGHNLGWKEGHDGATFLTFVSGETSPRPAPGIDHPIPRYRQLANPSPDRAPLHL